MGAAQRKPMVLGISGSPRRNNTEALLSTALAAAEKQGVRTKLISLAGKRILPCLGCYKCRESDGDSFVCMTHKDADDMNAIYSDICEADALMLASPVYFGTVSGQIKTVMDRFMPFYGGFHLGDKLTGKPGAGLAVGIKVHGGQELTIRTIHGFFLHLGMMVVGPSAPHKYCSYGSAGVEQTPEKKSVLKDESAVASAIDIGTRLARIALATASAESRSGRVPDELVRA